VTGARRAYTVVEMMVVAGIVALLASLLVIPAYQNYQRERQTEDAARQLAQDIGYLERFAQDSAPYEGATIVVQSIDPLSYTCYSGRPTGLDAQSYIRGVLATRTFPEVMLQPGPLSRDSPLLFARNGSVQYVSQDQWADQHDPIAIQLVSRIDPSVTAVVGLDPFTGAASLDVQPTPVPSPSG